MLLLTNTNTPTLHESLQVREVLPDSTTPPAPSISEKPALQERGRALHTSTGKVASPGTHAFSTKKVVSPGAYTHQASRGWRTEFKPGSDTHVQEPQEMKRAAPKETNSTPNGNLPAPHSQFSIMDHINGGCRGISSASRPNSRGVSPANRPNSRGTSPATRHNVRGISPANWHDGRGVSPAFRMAQSPFFGQCATPMGFVMGTPPNFRRPPSASGIPHWPQ